MSIAKSMEGPTRNMIPRTFTNASQSIRAGTKIQESDKSIDIENNKFHCIPAELPKIYY